MHTLFEFTNNFTVKLKLPLTRNTAQFQTDFNKDYIDAYVQVRPGVKSFFEQLVHNYDLVIWSASPKEYVDPIIDCLEIRPYVKQVLCKENCTFDQKLSVIYKNLDNLNRPLDEIIIIDNSKDCYFRHPKNGIQIKEYDGNTDQCLVTLAKYLSHFAKNGYQIEKLVHEWSA